MQILNTKVYYSKVLVNVVSYTYIFKYIFKYDII